MAEFKFLCPRCSQNIQCDTGYAGTQINCPSCKHLIVVPQPSSMSQSANGKKTTSKWRMIIAGASALFVVIAGLFLFWAFGKPSGLIGLWSGDGNGHDSAGGNNALLTDIAFAKGKTGQAFLFDSENAAIKIPANHKFRAGLTNGFTLEAWVKPSDVSRQNPIFEWNTGDGNTYWGVHFYIQPHNGDGALYANIVPKSGSWRQIWSPGGTVVRDEFQFVALTYDRKSGEAKLYCNGEVVAEQNMGHFAPQTSYDLYLGKRPLTQGESYVFKGLLENAAVYNRALSEEEIQADYHRHQ
jgi:DNA-directed RNA polymerase subunit RPC12/RpoP